MVKHLPAIAGDPGSVRVLGRTTGEGSGNPLQYSCLGSPMDEELVDYSPWGCSQTQLNDQTAKPVIRWAWWFWRLAPFKFSMWWQTRSPSGGPLFSSVATTPSYIDKCFSLSKPKIPYWVALPLPWKLALTLDGMYNLWGWHFLQVLNLPQPYPRA